MEALKECELREIFKEFDKNGDGKINRQELEVRCCFAFFWFQNKMFDGLFARESDFKLNYRWLYCNSGRVRLAARSRLS